MNKKLTLYVETAGKSCAGCTRCCEGWLTAEIYDFKIGPDDGPCRFLAKSGCGIYSIRGPLCKNFQCDWKENSQIPENMKPSLSNVIILSKKIEDYIYYRLVTAGTPIKEYVYDWAEEQASKGKHVVGYDNNGEFVIFSKDSKFRKLIEEYYVQTGV